MSSVVISPNMNLPIPIVGVEPGPAYASDVNNSLTIIDQHTHAAGSGVLITPAAININADLSINDNNLTLVRSLNFLSQASPLTGAAPDLGCLYESGVDLYFNDGSGNQIRITESGSVAGAAGTITGLPSGTASASYAAGVFTFQAATNTPANVSMGSAVLGNNNTSGFALTLSPPTLGSNYSLILPALPLALSFLTLDSVGNIGASLLFNNGITDANIAPGGISGVSLTNNINLPGSTVQENGRNLVVANTNAGLSLAIVRGGVGSAGNPAGGEGFTSTHSGTGTYTVAFTTAFSDTPMVVVSQTQFSGTPGFAFRMPIVYALSTGGFDIAVEDGSGNLGDGSFTFIAIGQRT